jgi:hypothetical protein
MPLALPALSAIHHPDASLPRVCGGFASNAHRLLEFAAALDSSRAPRMRGQAVVEWRSLI